MRYTGPKARLCRREGINLFGSPKYQKILAKGAGIPGMHGARRMGKLTEYARQLREKQKAKRIFCLSEKQFRNYFEKAKRSREVTGDKLLEFLEKRLDNVLYRAGLALTRMQARQLVSHGVMTLNGVRVDIPSILVKAGDVIEVRASKKKMKLFAENKELAADLTIPEWMKVDYSKLQIEIVGGPQPKDFEMMINTQAIVEFYSR